MISSLKSFYHRKLLNYRLKKAYLTIFCFNREPGFKVDLKEFL
jgi:hypothetical protein